MNHYEVREELAATFAETRRRTLLLAEAVPPETRSLQVHPGYSPFDWHLGHIGMTEWLWALQATGQIQSINSELEFIFANIPQNPKDNRSNLPDRVTILRYLRQVRERTLDFLQRADFDSPDPLLNDGFAFRFVLAHEWQHQETLIELLHLIPSANPVSFLRLPYADAVAPVERGGEICIPAGTFVMGTDDPHAYDNERPAHEAHVSAFAIDELPITVAQFRVFVDDGAYKRPEFWSEEGWRWAAANGARLPEYTDGQPFSSRHTPPGRPVGSVNWFEADAYARWAGKRLPIEAEWERAAAWDPLEGRSRRYPWGDDEPTPERADYGVAHWGPSPAGLFPAGRSALGVLGMAGGLWEWTSSAFTPYNGFVAYPYDGYSKDHFDGKHKVLKGGSWATQGPLLRCTFRNFYTPEYRQGFLGFRCARSL